MKQKIKKTEMSSKAKKNKVLIFGWLALGALSVAIFFTIFGMSNTIAEISEVAVSKTPYAILASAGVTEDTVVALPVSYYDQKADDCIDIYDASLNSLLANRQFEWANCNYPNQEIEQGLVEYELDSNHLPVAKGGQLTSNRGVVGSSNSDTNFTRWFNEVDGKSKSYLGTIKLDYRSEGSEFSFNKKDFYPLDDVEYDKSEPGNSDGHNHLFTMNFAAPFTALLSGNETFEITADDDTFVFVNDKLAIDMGGIHEATPARFVVQENGEIYAGVSNEELAYTGINLTRGSDSTIRIFHADRNSTESTFDVKFTEMNLTIVEAKFANKETEGVQIAYDPTNPSYVAPLGEVSIFRPDNTKGLIIITTIEGVLVVVFSIFVSSVARSMIRSRRKNN